MGDISEYLPLFLSLYKSTEIKFSISKYEKPLLFNSLVYIQYVHCMRILTHKASKAPYTAVALICLSCSNGDLGLLALSLSHTHMHSVTLSVTLVDSLCGITPKWINMML